MNNDFLHKYPINVEFWTKITSSLISAVVTIGGIWWTLDSDYKKSKEDLVNNNRPFLQYFISIGVYPYRASDQVNRTAILDYKLTDGGNQHTLIVPLDIKNIGNGHAIITGVTAKEDGSKSAFVSEEHREKIIESKHNSVFYIQLTKQSEFTTNTITISIQYKDMFGTMYEDSFRIEQFFNDEKDAVSESLRDYFDMDISTAVQADTLEALKRYFMTHRTYFSQEDDNEYEAKKIAYLKEIVSLLEDGGKIAKGLGGIDNKPPKVKY